MSTTSGFARIAQPSAVLNGYRTTIKSTRPVYFCRLVRRHGGRHYFVMLSSTSRDFFAYVRVSTVKQGEGVSLHEQRAAIERYTEKEGLRITQWFEETETAGKRGRPVFGQMMKLLKAGKAAGVVIHKIVRCARNLRDWADIGELIDQGSD